MDIKYTRLEILIKLIANHNLIYTCKTSPKNTISTSMSLIKKIKSFRIIKQFKSFLIAVLDY